MIMTRFSLQIVFDSQNNHFKLSFLKQYVQAYIASRPCEIWYKLKASMKWRLLICLFQFLFHKI